MINKNDLSPMMQRYFALKEQYQDCLLFFRLGDFYEMFFDDAVTASKALDLTLTGRACGLDERAPMCGVPYHAVDTYIRRLIDGGFRVAICEQLNDPATTKGMLDRDVVRVFTPGTIMEEEILDEKSANYLMSIMTDKDGFGLAWTDISTGEFCVMEKTGEKDLGRLSDLLSAISPAEIISNEDFLEKYQSLQYFLTSEKRPKCYSNYAFNESTATKRILSTFKISTLNSFEIEDLPLAIGAAGGLIEYLEQTQKRALKQLMKIQLVRDNSFMVLDAYTRRNLELTARARDGKRTGSLISVLDKTQTAMGARTLRRYIEQPLQDDAKINARLNGVEWFVNNKAARERLNIALQDVKDLERLAGRLAYGSATPKDLLSVSDTLTVVPDIKEVLKDSDAQIIKNIEKSLKPLENINAVLSSALDRETVQNYKNGGFVKVGYDEQLDELRNINLTAKEWLTNLENNEREETGIKTLKVGFNKVFGYYIEVSKSFVDKVPYRYQRKQTLVGGERYITDELKQIEEKVLSAESEANAIEERIFAELKQMLIDKINDLQLTAQALSALDALLSLSVVSAANHYVKPVINKKVKAINIVEGRHPVVETLLSKGLYVPNDTILDCDENRTMVITGPNMAGKSTYMRQVALITLMAHIGCFVPATSAEITLTDRIFTRIGASDDLSGGQSTFMVEMIEVATILNYATSKSLLLLDEIGRGTSTFDGLSIAWAVLEYITKNVKAKTLFATHFHELTELEDLEGVKNYRVLVSEHNDTIIFLHKIARGGASRSFGIEVASLAGVIKPVIEHAKQIMKSLEDQSKQRDTNAVLLSSAKASKTEQVSLFDKSESKIENEIRELNV
ncbi:MAG: DNA mismatch repair protein MutS, partial [Clostridia bacterium]|nr:DNA mismatch repair protein MutS [Clostridia bacterium]